MTCFAPCLWAARCEVSGSLFKQAAFAATQASGLRTQALRMLSNTQRLSLPLFQPARPNFVKVLDLPSYVRLKRRDQRVPSLPRICVEARVGTTHAIKDLHKRQQRYGSVPLSHPWTRRLLYQLVIYTSMKLVC